MHIALDLVHNVLLKKYSSTKCKGLEDLESFVPRFRRARLLSSYQAIGFPVVVLRWFVAIAFHSGSLSWLQQCLAGRTEVFQHDPWFVTSPSHHTLPNHDLYSKWYLSQSPVLLANSLPKPRFVYKKVPKLLIEETTLPPTFDLSHWDLHDDMPGHLERGFLKLHQSMMLPFLSTKHETWDPPNQELPVVRTLRRFHRHVLSHKRPMLPYHPRIAEGEVSNDDSRNLGTRIRSWHSCSFAHGCSREPVWTPFQRPSDSVDQLGSMLPRPTRLVPAAFSTWYSWLAKVTSQGGRLSILKLGVCRFNTHWTRINKRYLHLTSMITYIVTFQNLSFMQVAVQSWGSWRLQRLQRSVVALTSPKVVQALTSNVETTFPFLWVSTFKISFCSSIIWCRYDMTSYFHR